MFQLKDRTFRPVRIAHSFHRRFQDLASPSPISLITNEVQKQTKKKKKKPYTRESNSNLYGIQCTAPRYHTLRTNEIYTFQTTEGTAKENHQHKAPPISDPIYC
jgi:hypothetical protein